MGQQFKDRSSFTVDVSQLDRFHLYNRRGAVTVKAVSGNTATVQVVRSLKAKSQQRLDEAKEEIYMDSIIRNGEVFFFIEHPTLKLRFDDEGHAQYRSKDDSWWNDSDRNHVKAEFTVILEIPAQTDLSVMNHEHPLKISGMQGDLKAGNHHDGVLVENQGGSADVHSHHGDVEVFYTKNPTRECKYDTHHGDIRVHYQAGLSADASLYSYHGDFYTEFDWSVMPMTVSENKRGKGAKYQISGKNGTNIRIGAGGSKQKFRTHHGDIYLLQ